MNQANFGHLLGVTQSTISRWENGDDEPSDENLRSLLESAQKHSPSGIEYKNIAQLRYGFHSDVFETDEVNLFDLNTVANIGEKIIKQDNKVNKLSIGTVNMSARGRHLIGIDVEDESMQRFAPAGSSVVVDLDDRKLSDGHIGLFLTNEINGARSAVLRILRTEGPLRLEPSNPAPGIDTIFLKEDPVILGRAIDVVVRLPKKAI